jgi:phosphoglycolate phosphatase-like HAD superfamily hydrolase
LDDDDGTFRVQLLAKTGNLGISLLKNEFHGTPAELISESMLLEFVKVREGEPRCAMWYDDGRIESALEDEDDEFSVSNLNEESTREAVLRAQTVYLSSIKTAHFSELFSELLKTIDPAKGQGLFLDAERAFEPRDLNKLLSALKRATDTNLLANRIEGLFVPVGPIQESLLAEASVKNIAQFSKKYAVPVIQYGNGKTVRYWHTKRSLHATASCDVRFGEEGISEQFKAGVLLASSLYRALLAAGGQDPPTLLKYLIHEWADEGRPRSGKRKVRTKSQWKKVLEYAVCLARVKSISAESSTLRALLEASGESNSHHYPSSGREGQRAYEDTSMASPSGRNREVTVSPADVSHLAHLAGLRRTRNLECLDLPLCETPRCPDGDCPKQESSGAPPAAVLIDLDGTLTDSTEQRRRGLLAALRRLHSHDEVSVYLKQGTGGEGVVAFFEEHVYDMWPLFKALRLGDFRQEWNHMGWYTTYIVLSANAALRTEMMKWWLELDERSREDETTLEACAGRARWLKDFSNSYNRTADRCNNAISCAQEAFSSGTMRPFKEVPDLLRSLALTGAFSLYIVSEGHPETQWLKTVSMGLDQFFDRQHVLTTGDVAEPTQEWRQLAKEQETLAANAAKIRADYEDLKGRLAVLGDVDDALVVELEKSSFRDGLRKAVIEPPREEIAGKLRDLRSKLDEVDRQQRTATFVRAVLTRMAYKRGVSFYAAVVRSILRNPQSPLDELRSFRNLIDATAPSTTLKFAMIGDRPDNDIEPVIRLLGRDRVLTVRLLSEKYAERQPPRQRGSYEPSYVAHSAAQVKAILMAKAPWNEVGCTSDPRVFTWRIDVDNPAHEPDSPDVAEPRVGLDYVICGIQMLPEDFEVIYKVCSGVFAEHVVHGTNREQNIILNPFLRPDSLKETLNEGNIPETRRRVRILSSLVCGGATSTSSLSARREEFGKRLEKDRDILLEYLPKNDPDILTAEKALSSLKE